MDELPPEIRAKIKNIDDLPVEEREEILAPFRIFAKRQMAPYLKHSRMNLERAMRLIKMYTARLREVGFVESTRDGSEDILRAVVVLTHASLEDFLRTLAQSFLPYADEQALNNIPLAGLTGRAEKFQLGKLLQHKGKSVEKLIQESISEHLEKSNYNNTRDIVALLESIGFDSSKHSAGFPKIEAMIKRRHQIVHRGDMTKTADSRRAKLAPVGVGEVLGWVKATQDFMFGLVPDIPKKHIEVRLKEKLLKAGKMKR